MSGTSSEAQWPMFRRAARTVVVVDLVESVRLIEQDEEDTVRRWQAFVGEVVTQLLPPHGGRLVKSLGDGLMVEFEAVPPAIQCAIAMQTAISQSNQGRPNDRCMWLRVGAHVADVIVDERDIYGAGVNLAARLTTLAGPGEIVGSSEVVDRLVSGLDAEIEDLGECHLKHWSKPLRAYRIGVAGPKPVIGGASVSAILRPTVAVIPFSGRGQGQQHLALGEALADDVIAALSQSSDLQVVSRLSTAAFSGGGHNLEKIQAHLGAVFVLSGTYRLMGESVRVHAELSDTRDNTVLWANGLVAKLSDIFNGQDALVPEIVSHISAAIITKELQRTKSLPIPTLDAYTVYVGAVALLHRLSTGDFQTSRSLLEHLSERFPRSAAPHAMLAKWHVMQMAQGWSADPPAEGRLARASARRAIDLDCQDAFGLAVDGLVCAHVDKDLDRAQQRYREAIAANPNEPFAWAFLAGVHTYFGESALAESAADHAISLSPLDPARFYFDSYVAAAKLSAGKFDAAAEFARASIKRNACHAPSYRVLAIALAMAGRTEEARGVAGILMRMEPEFTVREYSRRYPGRGSPQAAAYAEALRCAGVPP